MNLAKEELKKLESKEKTKLDLILEWVLSILPVLSFLVAIFEYLFIKDKYQNDFKYRYAILLIIIISIYLIFLIKDSYLYIVKKDNTKFVKLINKAPWLTVIFLFLALFDYLTLKTGILMYPFIPWVNDIINITIEDHINLTISTLYSLRLLFLGYFIGVIVGLITGIFCGYSKKVRYWINPILKILGPIPTATWIPLIMIIFSSLFSGSVFLISLGVWFAVSVATMTGISNVDESYYEVARTLGASDRELIFKVAIPYAKYIARNDTRYEFCLYIFNDSRNAWCQGRTWMVYHLVTSLGKL